MPGNTVKINDYDELTWYVGDSKIEEVIQFLDKHGFRETTTEAEKKEPA